MLLWALDDRAWVRDAIREIHEQARDSALALLEEHAAFTRTGDVGQAQLATRGLIYAVFDHFDSRDGDPNLHTHVPISNKIQGSDGVWRSLDGRALHRIAVAASEHYNSQIETLATVRLGLSFAVRPDTARKRQPVREVAGVPVEFIGTFSSRRGRSRTGTSSWSWTSAVRTAGTRTTKPRSGSPNARTSTPAGQDRAALARRAARGMAGTTRRRARPPSAEKKAQQRGLCQQP